MYFEMQNINPINRLKHNNLFDKRYNFIFFVQKNTGTDAQTAPVYTDIQCV